jgi:HPt (histidine-containing phosphotransfer) domain-containing protein
MITGQATGPIRSRLVTDDAIAELVRDFVESLHKDASQLSALIAEGDVAKVRRLVHLLRSSGASYGFEPVSTAAAAVEDALQGDVASLDAVRAELNRLIEVLRRCIAG